MIIRILSTFAVSMVLPLLGTMARAQDSATVTATALDPVLEAPNLWAMAPDDFMAEFGPLGFRWVSEAKRAAEVSRGELTMLGSPVNGVIVRFGESGPEEVTVLFYNRGDAGELTKAKFDELLVRTNAVLSDYAKAKPKVLGKDTTSAVLAYGLQWRVANVDYLLEYSFTREVKTRGIPFRAEFVRLLVKPVEEEKGLLEAALAARDAEAKGFVGRDHVKKEANGDVVLEGIPMVDQGQKGYCVVATAERCMRYFGAEADQHELAQIANSSASKGTSIDAMMESLKKLTQRLRIRVREVEAFDVREVLKLIKDYNRAAKRGRRAPEVVHGHMIDLTDVYSQMQPEILKEVRTKNPASMNRFMRDVQSNVDEGIPLLWSVRLGVIPEKEIPQAVGGHMRLIIGYNPKTEEILYSDSWGSGHERKRMPLADAWTITTAVNTVEPI
jgi:hypothetical protein